MHSEGIKQDMEVSNILLTSYIRLETLTVTIIYDLMYI